MTLSSADASADRLAWLCCPICKRDLAGDADRYRCEACARDYPIVVGIADLRVYPDPHLSIAEDHEKGRHIEERAAEMSFAELLRFYWDRLAKAPPPAPLRQRFIRHVLDDEERARRLPIGDATSRACLDVGCGAGALPAVLAERFGEVVAADIGFRWLVLARKRLREANAAAMLVCCCSDYLPFRDRSFDLVTAISLLEHTRDARATIADCARVCDDSARLFVVSTNRFSLAPEPHVRIWGLGFLPRRWMPRIVWWRRRLSYDKLHLLSLAEVRRLLDESGFSSLVFSLPEIREADLEGRSVTERFGARIFRALAGIAVVRSLLLRVAPLVQVLAARRRTGEAPRPA